MNNEKKALNAYLGEISSKQLLSDAEEASLASRIQKGDGRALDKLMAHNLTYVVSVARQYKNSGLELEDLISEGNIGMLRAAKKFDGSQGKRFVVFAAPYIRDAMEKAIGQHAGLYRVPRDSANPPLDKRRSHALSIDAPVGGSPELSLGRIIPDADAPDPEQVLQKGILEDELKSLVATLAPREQHVVERFYGIGVDAMTMAEIGQEMGLTRERVRQIRNRAVRRILKNAHGDDLKELLRG